MRTILRNLLSASLIVSFLLTGCGVLEQVGIGGKIIPIQIVYGSEKQEWLDPLIQQFNDSKQKTADGSTIQVEGIAMGSIESVQGILDGSLQPVVWSPASSIYIPVANSEWRKNHSEDLVQGSPKDLVLSPVVIAMWKPMAEALGWPAKPIGWEDISKLAADPKGWESFGYPEWGQFKFGHTHPGYSNSGIVAIIAQTYAALNKQRGITVDDLKKPEVSAFMSSVQKSIIHYGTSTGFFATRMFERGPSYLSAAVMYENLVVSQENKRLANTSQQLPVVAIYPKEGTFWANHPFVTLNAPWVSDSQRSAADLFQKFLLDKPQQEKAIELGFRPADPSIPLTAPLDAQHGVDIQQPKTVLEVPSAEVIRGIQDLWKQTKKPVDLTILIDISGSMQGEKISAARSSLTQFIDLLADTDRLAVITFNSSINKISPLSELGPKRSELKNRVSGIIEGGNTKLYDAIAQAYQDLQTNGDPSHIRAVVVLSDGDDTASQDYLGDVLSVLAPATEDAGNAIKLFTIAYGSDADQNTLAKLADPTGGKMYSGDPKSIQKVYSEIATFF